MAVNFSPLTEELDRVCLDFANKAMRLASTNAPKDSGALAGSIDLHFLGTGKYKISTNAAGSNGFEYPARIEAGEWVVPNANNKRGAIWFKGNWHLAAAPSSKSHFMKNTVSSLHI